MESMSEKMGAMGGNMGEAFDDGVFDGVKKIIVGSDLKRVTYIKIEYEKDGKFEVREHGTIRGGLEEFSVDYPNEYITSVGGSYDYIFIYGKVLIKSLLFKTSYGRTSPILGHTTLLGNPAGNEFMLEGKNGGKLLGFHGRSGNALDAIGAHFFAVKTPLKHFNLQGGNGGTGWNDGAFDGVKKVFVGRGGNFVSYVRFEYAKGEKMVPHSHGTRQEAPHEFVVDYPNEHITLVEGTTDGYLTSLTFKTSKGRSSPVFGNVVGRTFVFGEKGFKLVGVCGRSGNVIDALGAHFAPLPTPPPTPAPAPAPASPLVPTISPAPTLIPEPAPATAPASPLVPTTSPAPTPVSAPIPAGGTGSNSGGSGSNPGGTGSNSGGIGGSNVGTTGTNPGPSGIGSNPGSTGTNIGSSPQKLEAQGSKEGNQWDDGANHDGVVKIHVVYSGAGIQQIRFDYVKNGQLKEGSPHGVKRRGHYSTVDINHPDEYLISVEGWYDSSNIILGIQFKTNVNTSEVFGYEFTGDGTQFSLQVKDKKIIGFHGFADSHLNSLGAYFAPSATSTTQLAPSFKLPAQGGNGGVSWDDGVHDDVRKVYVGQGDSGVAFVKFEYKKGSQLLTGDGHGKMSLLGTEEFVVDPDDYITSVKVYYEKLFGSKTEIITALIFKTFKGITSQPFGMDSGDFFLLEGGKITGFHGTASDFLHSIGAYMSLSPTPMLRGKWIQVEQKSNGPGPRCSHTIAMVGEKMYSFGGERTPNFHIDQHLYVFDFKTHTWSLAPPNSDVPELPCLGVCMVAIGTTLYVFGGRDGHRKYNGFYSYDTVKSEWKLITHVTKGPEPRSFHAMAADEQNIYVFGGVSTTERLNKLHAYNIVDQKWIELPNPGESCKPRGGPGLAVVQGKIWVVYGFTGDETDDVHCFDPVESKWTKVETSGEKPWARSVFSTAVLGKYIIISGGEIAMDPKAHMGPGKLTGGAFVLDTEKLMWQKLEEGHSPRGWCASTTASIDGKKGLLMYGGKAPTNGRYDDILFYGVDSA